MRTIRITYDPEGDILYITFGQPTSATGYQLSDQILLRVNPQTQGAAGLTIFNFSTHAQTTREIPLPGITEDPQVQSRLLQMLTSPPITHFLRVIEGEQGFYAILLRPSLQEAIVG
jgi:uncharacterized protein YuzE